MSDKSRSWGDRVFVILGLAFVGFVLISIANLFIGYFQFTKRYPSAAQEISSPFSEDKEELCENAINMLVLSLYSNFTWPFAESTGEKIFEFVDAQKAYEFTENSGLYPNMQEIVSEFDGPPVSWEKSIWVEFPHGTIEMRVLGDQGFLSQTEHGYAFCKFEVSDTRLFEVGFSTELLSWTRQSLSNHERLRFRVNSQEAIRLQQDLRLPRQ